GLVESALQAEKHDPRPGFPGPSLLQLLKAVDMPPYAVNPLKEVSMRQGVSVILLVTRPKERSHPQPERTRACRIETRTVVLRRAPMLKTCPRRFASCWAIVSGKASTSAGIAAGRCSDS